MIKQNHENESSQKISTRENLNRISQITFHIEIKRKICYRHILAINRFINNHCNNEFFSEKLLDRACKKKKIVASKKTYNRHVFEKNNL